MSTSKKPCLELPENLRSIALFDEPMCMHTSLGIGGAADVYAVASSEQDVISVLRFCTENRVPLTVVGKGSNLLVSDDGIEGVVLSLDGMNSVSEDCGFVIAQAGVSMGTLSGFAAARSLSGLEFLSGIPGTVGGAVAMNAGAHGRCLADVVEWVRTVDQEGIRVDIYPKSECFFSDRSSRFHRGGVVLAAALRVGLGDRQELMDRTTEYAKLRSQTQPLASRSAGCVFRNPPGTSAGMMIDRAGCKGLSIGDARVSTRHANFIVNEGAAKAADFLRLAAIVQAEVRKHFGVTLEYEVRCVGRGVALP